MWLEENHDFEPPIREPPKHFRTPRHYDNGSKMPCNLEAGTKSKVGTAHRPGSPWRRMTIPMALTDELWPSHLKLRPRIVKLRSANPLVSDRLRGSHLTLRPFFCPNPLPFGGSTVLSLTRGPAGNRTTTGSLSATLRVPRYQLHHEDDSHLKLRPLHCQVTTRQSPCLWHITTLILEIMTRAFSNYDPLIPLSVTHYDPRTWNYDPCTLKLRPAHPLVVTDYDPRT